MDLLIFSDSHGRTEGMELALRRQLRVPDAVLFLGDGLRDIGSMELGRSDLYEVTGNCDWFSCFCQEGNSPTERVISMEGHQILMTHGHLFGVKGGYGALLSHALEVGADIVISGHTHVPYLEILPAGSPVGDVILDRATYLFNPGSIGHDVDGKGLSFGTLTLRGDTVLFGHGRI
ncbi:MAG: YfcE family phosphodiesterase [Clostridia bacterium]|nr:YfcE family phosphodiesterase [Clostridia bacterium]